jgi:molybdopterin molybdotransferase
MDGYAVRASGACEGADLRLAGRLAAGDPPGGDVGEGEAVWVNTGAPLPAGTERVVPVEWTRADGDRIRVVRIAGERPYVVEQGSHARRHDVLVRRGTRLLPGHVSAAASAGHARLAVARRPVVAVLGTGTELVDLDERPAPGRIRNSNGPMLQAQIRRAGGAVLDLGIAPDDEVALAAGVRRGLAEADVLLLSGGVSQGDLDLVPGVLEAEGVAAVFHRWAVQPGGPLWFGRRGEGASRRLVFGLPGNPAATYLGFELLVVPALDALLGRPFAPRPRLVARYEGPWGRPMPRRRFRPVALASDAEGRLVARALPWAGSGDPLGPARMAAVAALGEDLPEPAGERRVDVFLLGAEVDGVER